MNLERIIMTAVIITLAFTLALSSSIPAPLTREEAIEASKGSTLVQKGLAKAYGVSVETHYHNSTEVEQKKKDLSQSSYENVPEGHSVWEIVWYISEGIGGYVVGVFVDAETGEIIGEVPGTRFL